MTDQPTPTVTPLDEPESGPISAAITTGALVATIVVEWPQGSGEKRSALLFSFATHDGDLLPPIVYVGDDLKDLASLVNSAVELSETIDVDAVEVPATD